jgi:hypothetical protein
MGFLLTRNFKLLSPQLKALDLSIVRARTETKITAGPGDARRPVHQESREDLLGLEKL